MRFSKVIELQGHIIDSLTLPKVYDTILGNNGAYLSEDIRIGRTKKDISYARIRVGAEKENILNNILEKLSELGADVKKDTRVKLGISPANGTFPKGYCPVYGRNLRILYNDKWIPVRKPSMKYGIRINEKEGTADAVCITEVKKGEKFVLGRRGVKEDKEKD